MKGKLMTGYFRGIPLEDMTKEQLIEAIREMYEMMEHDRKRYDSALRAMAIGRWPDSSDRKHVIWGDST